MRGNSKNKKIKKLIFVLLLLYFLISPVSLALAQEEGGLEISYPEIPGGVEAPVTKKAYLPHYIQYIYNFIVISGGIIALLALIYGGFRYLTSVGNPEIMRDARGQILAGFLGLIIILGSYVILYEINPDLVSMRLPIPKVQRTGIIVYNKKTCAGLGANAAIPELLNLEKDVLYKALRGSGSAILETKEGEQEFPLSFYTFHSSDELKLELFTNEECTERAETLTKFVKNNCYEMPRDDIKCIKFVWWRPGVWVFDKLDGKNPPDPLNLPEDWQEEKDYMVFRTTQEVLPLEFSDDVKAIALVPDNELKLDYGVVLHNIDGGMMEEKGFAQIILPGNPLCQTDQKNGVTRCNTDEFNNISSITVFNLPSQAVEASTLWTITACRQDRCIRYRPEGSDKEYKAQLILRPGPGKELQDITGSVGGGGKYSAKNSIVFAKSFHNEKWPEIDEPIVNNGGDSGISGVKIEKGASYLVLLYHLYNPNAEYSPVRRSGNDAAIINRSNTSLKTIGMDDVIGTIVVIRIER